MLRTLLLLFSSLLLLLAAYYLSSSPLILSELSHSLIDFLTVLFSAIALSKIKNDHIPNGKFTYGLHRLEIVVALINISVIVILSVFILYESIISVLYGIKDNPLILILASIFVSILIYFANQESDQNNIGGKGIYIHLLSDFISYVIGIFMGLIILIYRIYILDPIGAIITMLINIIISMPLLKEAFLIFMEGSPVNINEVEEELRKIEPNIHHLHVWSICNHVRVATLHVKVSPNLTIIEADKIRSSICSLLRDKYNINHVTVQFEAYNED